MVLKYMRGVGFCYYQFGGWDWWWDLGKKAGRFQIDPIYLDPMKQSPITQKQPAWQDPTPVTVRGQRSHADFGFMRASTEEYGWPGPSVDQVVESYEGFNAYLAITDEILHHIWVFLVKSKELPIYIMHAFLSWFSNESSGLMHTNEGGELARSTAFWEATLKKTYSVEPTSAYSPLQNGCA